MSWSSEVHGCQSANVGGICGGQFGLRDPRMATPDEVGKRSRCCLRNESTKRQDWGVNGFMKGSDLDTLV